MSDEGVLQWKGLWRLNALLYLHQRAAHHLLLRVPGDLHRLPIPLVDQARGVDAKDRRVGRLDEHFEIGGDLGHFCLGL